MQNAERNRIIPFDRDNAQKRMDILPFSKPDQNMIAAFTFIKHIDIEEGNIFDLNLRMFGPKLISKCVGVLVPAAPDQHDRFAI